MANTYWLNFGTNDPRSFTGLSPTFVLWYDANGATLTPPGITEIYTGSGDYRFQYSPTLAIKFLADGGATLTAANRYVSGSLDPVQSLGASFLVVGDTTASFGSTSVDPANLFGYLKRIQEILEGQQIFAKSTGILDIYNRGATTLLRELTLTDNTTQTTRT